MFRKSLKQWRIALVIGLGVYVQGHGLPAAEAGRTAVAAGPQVFRGHLYDSDRGQELDRAD